MSSQRLLLVLILAGLVASSLLFNNETILVQNFLPQLKSTDSEAENKPDFTISTLNSRQFDQNGKLDSQVFAEELEAFPKNELTRMQDARIHFFDPASNKVSWDMKADFAESKAPHSDILLQENVILKRLGITKDIVPAKVFSEEMWVDTKKKSAHSESPVRVISRENEINGRGFTAQLNSTNLSIHADVASQYKQPTQTDPGNFTTIKSDQFKLEYQRGFASYTGNVTLVHDNIRILADQIDIQRAGNYQTATAYGEPAYFEQESRLDQKTIKAQAKRFEFNNQEEKLKMFDSAVLEQDGAVVHGDYLYYDTNSETIGAESRPDSRVKMVLPGKNTPEAKP